MAGVSHGGVDSHQGESCQSVGNQIPADLDRTVYDLRWDEYFPGLRLGGEVCQMEDAGVGRL